jgi:hypothetical protein
MGRDGQKGQYYQSLYFTDEGIETQKNNIARKCQSRNLNPGISPNSMLSNTLLY